MAQDCPPVHRAVIAALTLTAALVAAAMAHAAPPRPIGTPDGVYTGKVRVAGVSAKACRGCRTRIVLTHDGLEISGASTVTFGRRSTCALHDVSDVIWVRIRRDGTYRTLRTEGQNVPYSLVGRVTRTRITGRGLVLCARGSRSVERRLTFTARRTGRLPFDATATVRCEPIGGDASSARIHVTVRGLGCGLGHDAARGAPGLRCATVQLGAIEPAAQRRCVASGDPVSAADGPMAEITRLADCTTGELQDSGILVHAVALVGCRDARRFASAFSACDTNSDDAAACADAGAFTCRRDELLRVFDSDRPLRCGAPADPRRRVDLLFSSSDSV